MLFLVKAKDFDVFVIWGSSDGFKERVRPYNLIKR